MASQNETYSVDLPASIQSTESVAYEAQTSGPIILEHLPEERLVYYGDSTTLRVQYGHAKYPVNITWLFHRGYGASPRVLETQTNMIRGGWTSLNLKNIRKERTFEVVIEDPFNRRQASSICTVSVIR
ncbi:uncharacterized protein [Amphiura filiformis]|uniref:uncharacterized protein n=1 Tax=Amphiura filiformis TaxID=82378 RepID=UPI003B226412